jgi:beta-galactosidase GanA
MSIFTKKGSVKTVEGNVINPVMGGLKAILLPISANGKIKDTLGETITKRWSNVSYDVRNWFVTRNNYKMGNVITTFVNSEVQIISMLCRDDKDQYSEKDLETCFKFVSKQVKLSSGTLHVAQSTLTEFPNIQLYIDKHILSNGFNVLVYKDC